MKKKLILILFTVALMLSSCARHECKTPAGKKKAKYYRSLQYQ